MILTLVVAGCGGDKKVKPEGAGAAVEDRDVRTGGLGQGYGPDGRPIGAEDPLSKRTIYFEFDSADVDDASRVIIEAHARYLIDNPDIKVVLEGHADERGTREYNLALGERRSKAVADMMAALGVARGRITSISYGEEKPAALGHDESAWSLNRRVELLYGSY
jgi:peptidoglycan-associated lipoprotein